MKVAKKAEKLRQQALAQQQQAIFNAAKNLDQNALQAMRIQGLDLTVTDEEGRSIMHHAAFAGADVPFLEMCKQKFQLRYTAEDREGRTPAHYAAMGGHIDSFEFLSRRYNPINETTYMNLLVLDHNKKTPLHVAAEYGQLALVKFILIQYLNCKRDDVDALLTYDESHLDKEIVVELLCAGDHEGINVVHYAAMSGDIATFEWVSQFVDIHNLIDNVGRNCLILAARSDRDLMVEHLIKVRNLDPFIACKNDFMPAHHCVIRKAKKALAMLGSIDSHSYQLSNKLGLQPIHIAAKKGYTDMFDFLEQQQVDITACDKFGRNCWYLAAAGGELDMLNHLELKALPLVLGTDKKQQNPLHLAVLSGKRAVVRFFFKKDSSLNVADANNRTPENLAQDKLAEAERNKDIDMIGNYTEIRNYLQKQRNVKHTIFKGTQSSLIEEYPMDSPAQSEADSLSKKREGDELSSSRELKSAKPELSNHYSVGPKG